jgi:putative cardiolipin synthase
MHNKIIIADNSFAVLGGRNVGDHYFAVDPQTNFRDLDIAAVGPVVREMSGVFDHFWAGEWSVPITALVDRSYTRDDLALARTDLRELIEQGSYPYPLEKDIADLRAEIREVLDEVVIWAPAHIIWDNPEETLEIGEDGSISRGLRTKLDTVEKSVIIESAYFVPGDRGVERVRSLVDRGVSVRILTNSLASNDVLAAHAGHANYRKALVEAGAELYEFRPDSSVIKKTWVGEAQSGLHTKAFIFDDESLFIGSFNLDPRSANINTEAGLYVQSAELARQLREYMDEGVLPQHAYRLTLDEDGDLLWTAANDGVEVQYHKDPMSTWWQRFMSGFIGILPVESQL